ncbi:MAG: carboxypeptidase-like regulatory domain-containing protein [Spirosomataceae bacterium]
MRKSLLISFIFLCLAVLISPSVMGQGERKAIMFTGIVVGADQERLPMASIIIPKAGKGTIADADGYFVVPVFPGDSLVFSYVGYKNQYFKIPKGFNGETFSAIIAMREDVQMLQEVRVWPYSTEEEFKKAFLEMRLPDQADRDALAKSTDPDYINRMSMLVPNNAQTNFRHSMDQQLFGRESYANRGFSTTMPFLNPFAWANFIKSVKKGDFKRKEWQKELNQAPRENITRQDYLNPGEVPRKNFD